MAEESTTYESLLKARGIPADPQDEEVVVDEGVLSSKLESSVLVVDPS